MGRPIEYSPIHLSLEQVAVQASRKVLVEFDDNILLIVGDPQWILDEHLRPHMIHVLNIIIILLNYIRLDII
jgi:hypothetical protein